MNIPNDPYYKRRLSYSFNGETLEFDTAALLSSAHELDPGVDLLLRALLPTLSSPPASILDLACNYGQLGLTLARHFPSAQVVCADKDLLALRYTRRNAILNRAEHVQVRESLGVRSLHEQMFDLIVADVPSKIGDAAIERDFILEPLRLLSPQGTYWLVGSSQLNRLLPGLARKHHLRMKEIIRRDGRMVFTLQQRGTLPQLESTQDVSFKKQISYKFNGQAFQFDVAELLFSSHDIDVGTQLLLRQMLDLTPAPRSILDLGCGYGVIGIVLARFYPQAEILLSDKDLLAVAYTARNIALNDVSNAHVQGSISTDDLPERQYDLIASNIPGHIGELAIEQDFLLKPFQHLEEGGRYFFVIVQPLRALVEAVAQRYELPLTLIVERSGHAVYTLRKA